MRIVSERGPKFTDFKDMPLGTIFLDEDDDVMMKFKDGHEAKAISLKTGEIYHLHNEYEGIVVDATLTIR